ncbi:hypothetical protein Z517_02893 [Fonsecaea pedrosoi CBS 271.37]|uniref:Uncharacterized protein n=1 Tax=Fonsecaea pedrosoi CBS 271.37 TaxID=1442368 RepID=A0A0D2FAH0_9EURO|nr:uncharacterized protein Z517_02893 [Fonsecaea pedrosoi CBS 271.37]KIW83647.1 hypothetical protein Z517_02893 [Fonsecaea pedrosoi CBS 271.37]
MFQEEPKRFDQLEGVDQLRRSSLVAKGSWSESQTFSIILWRSGGSIRMIRIWVTFSFVALSSKGQYSHNCPNHPLLWINALAVLPPKQRICLDLLRVASIELVVGGHLDELQVLTARPVE